MTEPFVFESKPQFATREGDNIFVRAISSSTAVLLLLGVVGCAIAFPVAVLQEGIAADIAAGTMLLLSLPAVVWGTIQSLWRVDERHGIVRAALIYRTIFLSVLVPMTLFLTNTVLAFFPPLNGAFAAKNWKGSFPAELLAGSDFTVMQWLGMNALMSILICGISSLVLSLVIVFPIAAVTRPQQTIDDWYLSTAPEHRLRNTVVVRILAVTILLMTVGATLIAVAAGMQSDGAATVVMVIGAALLLLIFPLLFHIWRIQRVDHKKMRDSIWISRPYNNPNDPPSNS